MHHLWTERLEQVLAADVLRALDGLKPGHVPLYPTILLCVDAGPYFVAELVGTSEVWQGLTLTKQRAPSVEAHFHPFEGPDLSNPMLCIEGERFSFFGVSFANTATRSSFEARFPFLQRLRMPTMINSAGGPPMRFAPTSNFTSFSDCMMLSRIEGASRMRWILWAIVIRADTAVAAAGQAIEQYLVEPFGRHSGYTTVRTDGLRRLRAANQLASLFLSGVREPTIGTFLEDHPDMIPRALGVRSFLSERRLEWQPGTTAKGDGPLIPDLLIEDGDGTWGLCDLKLALRNRASIVRGERERRRFIDNVAEGIAQLTHYAEYFGHSTNREWVAGQYGAEFTADPSLTLIVGNAENAPPEEISEAARAYRHVRLVDWDSFVTAYVRPGALEAA